MADYRSILDRAIDGLQNNTDEARRAIYEKARGALMRQLSTLEPALSPAEISKQRLQLEEAVRETEGKFSGVGALEDAVADALTDLDLSAETNIVEAEPAAELPEPSVEQPVVAEPIVEAVVSAPEPVVAEPVSVEPTLPEIPEPAPVVPDPVAVETPIVEPEIPLSTQELPTIDDIQPALEIPTAGAPAAEIPSVEVSSPEIAIPTTPIDVPPVNVEPALPPIVEPSIDAVAPTLSADQVELETADLATPSVDFNTPEISPLDELRETMVADGVDLPPVTDDFSTGPQGEFSTFEAPDPNSFNPDEIIAAVETEKSSGKGLLWILVLLLLIGGGIFAWAQREVVTPVITQFNTQVSGFISSLGSSENTEPATTQPAANTNNEPAKSEDRVPTAGGTDDNIQPGTRVTLPDSTPSTDPVVVTPQAPASDATQDQSSAADPAPETEAAVTPSPANEEATVAEATPQTTTPASNLFSSSAILYEERPGSNQPGVSAGNVLWEIVPTGSEAIGSTGLPSVKGSARIESRDITVRFELMRNLDPNLPASHLIEFEFSTGPLFNGDEINNIAGVIAKEEEQKNGTQLKGAIVKVSERVFWVAMSAQAADLAANTDALQQQNWFDIPLVFKSGKRAILTLEKGAAGKKAIEEAFKSWQASN